MKYTACNTACDNNWQSTNNYQTADSIISNIQYRLDSDVIQPNSQKWTIMYN